nr:MAG TPA: hypothetical protein [Caudoviricetes sp.]
MSLLSNSSKKFYTPLAVLKIIILIGCIGIR